MAERTAISWTDATFNPWVGCTKVGPGCDNCYAEALMDNRMGRVNWGAGNPRSRTSASNWRLPRRWNKKTFYECQACGWRGDDPALVLRCKRCLEFETLVPARRRVFCASLADVFDNEVDPAWLRDLFQLIADTPNLDWLLLTKRIGNVERLTLDAIGTTLLPWNVWLGATVVNQEEADRDIPKLLRAPARVRFLSIEPLLGPIDLCEVFGMWWNQTMGCFEGTGQEINRSPNGGQRIDWAIVGGESGPQARPMVLGWAKAIVRQCQAAGVAVHVKQLGRRPTNREGQPHPISDDKGKLMSEWPAELRVQEFPA